MDWCRWHNGTSSDPKWRVIAKRAGVPLYMVIAVWPFLVEAANQGTERGTMDNPDADDIAEATDIEAGQVTAILAAMQGKVLSGNLLTGWAKRNPKRERESPDDSASRVRKHREAQRGATVTEISTCDNVTPCNAMKRPDREREREIDREPTPLPPKDGGRAALMDEMVTDLTKHAEAHFTDPVKRKSFVAKARGLIAGEDATAWQDGTAKTAPWEDRPRIFRLALDRLAGEDSASLRGALKWVVAQQIDPDRVRPAIQGEAKARTEQPVNRTPDHVAELAKLNAEHPQEVAAAIAELERYPWWASTPDWKRAEEIRDLVRDRRNRPRIVA